MKTAQTLLLSLFFSYFNLYSQNFEWAHKFGSMKYDKGYSIDTDLAGNVYTVGSFQDSVDFDNGLGNHLLYTTNNHTSIFILKSDPNGNYRWAFSICENNPSEALAITTDIYANIYVTGYFQGSADFDPSVSVFNLSDGIFIAKYDSAGNFVWAKNLGSVYDKGTAITIDNANNIYLTGSFVSTVDFDPGTANYSLTASGGGFSHPDIFVLKLDASGNFVWAANMGGAWDDYGTAINVDGQGNVYTTGHFMNNADFDPSITNYNLSAIGLFDVFVSKLNSTGDFLWAKSIGASGYDGGKDILTDSSGNVYITGFYRHTVDFDPDSGVFTLGAPGGNLDIFILKLDALGNFIWAKRIGGTDDDAPFSLELDNDGNFYLSGFFRETPDFDIGLGVFNLTATSGSQHVFVSKYTSMFDFVWAVGLGGIFPANLYSTAIDNFGNVYSTGGFWGTVDFDPSPVIFNLSSSTQTKDDIFILKMSQSTIGIIKNSLTNLVAIYPNPANDILTIELLTQSLLNTSVSITNLFGDELYQLKFSNQPKLTIDLGDFPRGIFFMRIENENGIVTQKIIIADI